MREGQYILQLTDEGKVSADIAADYLFQIVRSYAGWNLLSVRTGVILFNSPLSTGDMRTYMSHFSWRTPETGELLRMIKAIQL